MTLIYHRHNVTEELLASIFSVSQPTVSRTITSIEKALARVLKPLMKPMESALKTPGSLAIDGTLIPTWNWRSLGATNFSGKHKRAGVNHQVICTLDGKLLAITDPVPGMMLTPSNIMAWKDILMRALWLIRAISGWGWLPWQGVRKTRRTPADVKAVNRFINSRRAVVERVIAPVLAWRVLHTGFRRPLGSYSGVFAVVRGLIFLAAGHPL